MHGKNIAVQYLNNEKEKILNKWTLTTEKSRKIELHWIARKIETILENMEG